MDLRSNTRTTLDITCRSFSFWASHTHTKKDKTHDSSGVFPLLSSTSGFLLSASLLLRLRDGAAGWSVSWRGFLSSRKRSCHRSATLTVSCHLSDWFALFFSQPRDRPSPPAMRALQQQLSNANAAHETAFEWTVQSSKNTRTTEPSSLKPFSSTWMLKLSNESWKYEL